ncbi:Ku protein [Paenibacillus sp. GSMTC-2017]|uniref:non-homologous end joining protein Ku n=1 Tax=Paenibacillus sp. GSMTC-2017 TaxID=2794350 RepID=UPI0018D7A40D|nr:Ku protein [Paenibacillus sp. GSMTC-2017]MBH5319492.1 Ku protein [Paenibacillus sp. GSMTC-2017]
MHTVWKGAISFGLVHVPVKMFTAVEDKDISFRSLHKDCGMPINYAKTCRHCDKEISPDEIVKGFEYEKDKFVIVNNDELEEIKDESAKTIKILDFVDLQEIDPLYFQKAYYLSPDMAGAGAYSLLLEAIKQTGKIGIAKVSIRSKSSLAAIRVVENCICLETMHFPDEIRSLTQVPNLPSETVLVNEKELLMAKALVEQLSEQFDPTKYTDDYRIALTQLIEQKIANESTDIVAAPASEGRSNVIDLMTALQASLDATKAPTVTDAPKKKKRKPTSKAKDTAS